MRLGNILASIGIILGILGFICLPFWNLRELPYLADPGYGKGGGWILLVQTGLFTRPGILLMVLGGLIYLTAKLLPKKFWYTSKDLLTEERRKGYRKKKPNKRDST